MRDSLPIDAYVDQIVATVREKRRVIIVAPPGSGKTTRVPPALVALGPTILLQPRRVAARALTRRIAEERQWKIGEEIGWQIRFERRFSAKTQLLVATEGILTARLQSDPLLSDFNVVILDEFHERSIHADLALALVRQAALSRDDLSIVVRSATIDWRPIAEFLGAPVIEIETRRFPIETRYRPNASVPEAIREAAATAKGHVLAFLPGAREIDRAAAALPGMNVFPLHGSLDVDAQERALAPSATQKIILATNVAETSLTVDGVTDVIDSGQQKVLRFDTDTAVDHLVTELISRDSADQRAGRAGRTGPGRATRLWDERMLLRPQREPEVRRIDLTGPVLDIISWGGDPKTFEWFERPAESRIDAALDLLQLLGAIEGGRLTTTGVRMQRIPLHPRLARMVIESREAVPLAVEISEGIAHRATSPRSRPDVVKDILSRLDREGSDSDVAKAALAAYPDRVAMRREKDSPRLILASGTGATLAREIEHTGGEWFAVLEIRGELAHRVIAIERAWLAPTRREVVHSIENGRVRAMERDWYGGILLREQQARPDPIEAERLLDEYRRLNVDPELALRLKFAGMTFDDPRHRLETLAPSAVALPSGRKAALEYREDGSVIASAKLQELFGLAETPRIGPGKTPITFALLAPNGRPVQVTQDLKNFWNTTYFEVRKELRARYPRHPWPDDPWTATPTHRTKRR